MVKEDLKAQLRTKRKQAKKQIQQQQQPKKSQPKPNDGPSLLTLIYTRKWDQCVQVATSYPKQTERPDRMGDLPLHEACNSGAPFQLIQAIHRSYPSAISTRGFCGRLPLHYASYNKPSLHVIKYLLRLHPDGATQFDDDGRLPLHLAVVRNAPKQAIQALIAAYPKSLSIPNQFGNTPEMLARNDHVYNLLVAEKDKPRGIDQKLNIEKKLMRDWNLHSSSSGGSGGSNGKKSPVAVLQQLGNKPTDSMESSSTPKRGSLSIKKQPLSSSDNGKVSKRTQGPSATTTTTKKKEGVQNKSWTIHLTQVSARKTAATTRRSSTTTIDSSSKKKNSRTNSRSLSSGRSRRTIEATHDDLIFLEDTMMNPKYVASSRLESPKSPLDYNEIIQTRRAKKKEIMSTTNRRKVLPSPTRTWQYPSERDTSDRVEWKRRQFSRTVV